MAFKEFYNMVHIKYQHKIRIRQLDNAMEIDDALFSEYLRQLGIRHNTSCRYTPQQNGLAERKNRQIMEVVHSSLIGMNMLQFYWSEEVKFVVYLTYRVPSRVIVFQNPQDKLYSFCSITLIPNLEPGVFGCTVYVHIPKVLQNKLDHCAIQCILLDFHIFNKAINVIIHARKNIKYP